LTGQHVLGSPVYMSPEQLRNATDIDGRADIWSIGIVAYEMLSGDPPFDGAGVGEIFAAILEQVPAPLTEKNPKITQELSDIVAKCLCRDPNERWEDVGKLARALAPFGSEAQAPLVERADQVLARARQMHVQRTPLETRRVVAAIEAAATRAITTSTRNEPALLLLTKPRNEKDVATTREDGVSTQIQHMARRSPLRVAALVFGLVAVLGLCTFGAVRATRSSSAAVRAAADHGAASVGATGETNPASPAESAEENEDPPLVMDLPSNPNGPRSPARARGSKTNGGKPQRPKFLNSRE
ncbi:MAG: Serine/threonine protein kinase PrkC, regulator of stationary phase, partial [Labilithrix sp.]|nr:Serine/threonine protein kinase PrkC, regulator of stationary phase [Labilithrix sp.]